PPIITSIDPAAAGKGQAVDVKINGSGFIAGATINVSGTKITVGPVGVTSTQLTAKFTIDPDADEGPRSVTVSTTGGTSAPAVFTVYGKPTITAIAPHFLGAGTGVPQRSDRYYSNPVTVTGTGFVAGTTKLAVNGFADVIVQCPNFSGPCPRVLSSTSM